MRAHVYVKCRASGECKKEGVLHAINLINYRGGTGGCVQLPVNCDWWCLAGNYGLNSGTCAETP